MLRVIQSNAQLLVPRRAYTAAIPPSRVIIETVSVGLFTFRTMISWPRPLLERSVRFLRQKIVVIQINVVLLEPVICESIALHKGVDVACLVLGRRLMVLWLFKLGPSLILRCTLPILSTSRQELRRARLNQVAIPILLVLEITILKKIAWVIY